MATRRGPSRRVLVLAAFLAASAAGCGGSTSQPGASAVIGPAGGSVALEGGPRLDVPAGALAADTRLTVEPTGLLAPGGAPIYRFGPDGTTFAEPVTVTLPLPPGAAAPAVFWSRPGSTSAFDVVPATVEGDRVRAQGTHFSALFVGPSAGDALCAAAGTGTDGTPCGGGRTCRAGACLARLAGTVSGAAAAGVAVTLSGDAAAVAITDGAGGYAFDGLAAGTYTVTPALEGHAFTPAAATVELGEASVDGLDFAAWRPVVAALAPAEGHVGASVTLTGEAFGPPGQGGEVTLGGRVMPVTSWSDRRIVVEVPSGARPGPVQVRVGTGTSLERPFVVTATVSGLIVDAAATPAPAGSWAAPAQLHVAAAGTGRSDVSASVPGAGSGGLPRAFSLELPLGTHALAVEERDGSGQPTLDLLQEASRAPRMVEVTEEGAGGIELPVRWHWEVHPLDPGFPVCGTERQIHFRDADHGLVTFQVSAGADPAGPDRVHGMVMATEDGGRSWRVLSADMSPELTDFRPSASGWYPTGHLLALADGTVLSAGEGGQLVRSSDSGLSWSAGALNWAAAGPGFPTVTRFAPAGDRLHVSVSTGGVQSSSERSQLLTSADRGLTWARTYDVCSPNRWLPDGCPTAGVPLGFAGLDVACSDSDPRRCVAIGSEHDSLSSVVLVTQDGFETFRTVAAECGYFSDGQVLWFPGTQTAWVSARSSCPGLGTRRIVTTDGGATFGEWGPSPLPGRAAFADASHGLAWWDWGVRVSGDGGATWRYTGHAPAEGGVLRSVHVLDAGHAWVLGHPDCGTSGVSYVARWVP